MAAIKSSRDGTLSLAPSLLLSASPHAHPAAPCPIVSLWRLFICICTGTLPGCRPSAGAGVPLMARVPDVLCAASIHLPRPAPWENSEPSFYQAYHEITASSPPRPPSATFLTLSFSPTLALAVSHMLISHGCTHSLQQYRELSASDLLCSTWMHRLPCSCHPLMMQPHAHLFIPPRDICMEYFHLYIHNYSSFVSSSVAMFGGGSNGTLKRPRWIKVGQR